MTKKRRITVADVAAAAGVSQATVSYVMNEVPGRKFSKETAERVRAAAEELGYVRNRAAQALARGRTNLAILDMSDFVTQESASLAAAPLLDLLRKVGWEPYATWWREGEGRLSRTTSLIRFVAATNPVAVVSVLPLQANLRGELAVLGVEHIVSLVPTVADILPVVGLAARAQVEYLASVGHEEILFAGGSWHEVRPMVEQRAAEGARTAAELSVGWTQLPFFDDVPHLVEILREAIERHPRATAIAAYNDVDALSVLFALHSLGVAIPERMAVIGVDSEDFGPHAYPPLSTVVIEYDLADLDTEQIYAELTDDGEGELLKEVATRARFRALPRESA